MNLFRRALAGEVLKAPPIWLMRQAGRYHQHYQRLRARHSFETLCREPELAAEVTMGPVADFDFDAAILFSDLLFPLEALGFGLSYADGPPKLDGSVSLERIAAFRPHDDALQRLQFQGDAMRAIRTRLPAGKGLIGFVGGPWTLFVYALEGTHGGSLSRSKAALDLYRRFADRMVPLLKDNIRLQLEGGADVVMVFDTAAGELAADDFANVMAPDLSAIARAFPQRLGYYAKGPRQQLLRADEWAGFGFDAGWVLADVLRQRRAGFVQGNFDQTRLKAAGADLDADIDAFLAPIQALTPDERRGWICGLGHGVLPGTPEDNVRRFVARVREAFL